MSCKDGCIAKTCFSNQRVCVFVRIFLRTGLFGAVLRTLRSMSFNNYGHCGLSGFVCSSLHLCVWMCADVFSCCHTWEGGAGRRKNAANSMPGSDELCIHNCEKHKMNLFGPISLQARCFNNLFTICFHMFVIRNLHMHQHAGGSTRKIGLTRNALLPSSKPLGGYLAWENIRNIPVESSH